MSLAATTSPPPDPKDAYDALVERMEPFLRFPQVSLAIQRSKAIPNAEARLEFLAQRLKPFFEDLALKARWENGRVPVDPQTFVEHPDYLNKAGTMWPKNMAEFVELNSGKYIEGVITGGIGTGKSTIAIYTTAYQLYLISCMKAPHATFGLDEDSEIIFVFQSINEKLALGVDFERFCNLVERAPYFKEHFPGKITKEQIEFPKNIWVKPLSGAGTAALGQNVIGGFMDEVNFGEHVEVSTKSHDGGAYDQMWANYHAIVRRRESRFMRGGKLPGLFCLVSSKNHPGDFTDKKQAEAKEQIRKTGQSTIFVYDKRYWEVCPDKAPDGTPFLTGKWFRLFIGDASRKPRFVEDDEAIPPQDQRLVMRIPLESRHAFEDDMIAALRDVAGIATEALHPFILEVECIADCFGRRPSILTVDACDFAAIGVGVKKGLLLPEVAHLNRPRWVHIDLSIRADSCGLSCGYVSSFAKVNRGDHVETMPNISFDFVLEIRPPKNGEILFHKVRALIYTLSKLGLPIKWVSLDSYQSFDMIQQLQQKGYKSELRSVDTSTIPYDVTKQALMDRRVYVQAHPKAAEEFRRLEFNPKKKMIDHPSNGSKDLADSMASVVFGLTMMAENWIGHGVPISEAPLWLKQLEQASRNKSSTEGRIGQ